jgi:hypothetical protein
LTECGDLSEVEAEETETAVVVVKTAEAIETAAVTVTMVAMMVKAAATLKMATTAESEETVAPDITNGKDGGRWHIGENTGL